MAYSANSSAMVLIFLAETVAPSCFGGLGSGRASRAVADFKTRRARAAAIMPAAVTAAYVGTRSVDPNRFGTRLREGRLPQSAAQCSGIVLHFWTSK
jgi:hypothetical protein